MSAEEKSQNSKGIVKKNEIVLDLPDNMDENKKKLEIINIWLEENERERERERVREQQKEAECEAKWGHYTILRILNNIANREAEKVSCRPGCYGAKQKYEETWDKLLSTESFDSDYDSE